MKPNRIFKLVFKDLTLLKMEILQNKISTNERK